MGTENDHYPNVQCAYSDYRHPSTQVRCEGLDVSLKAIFQPSVCVTMVIIIVFEKLCLCVSHKLLIIQAAMSKSSHEEVSGYLSGIYDSVQNGESSLTSAQRRRSSVTKPSRDAQCLVSPAVVYINHVYNKTDTEARQKISYQGQTLVGWFHSHPDKTYHPSVYDVECHLNYQLRLQYQPLVACIIGTSPLRPPCRPAPPFD